MVTARRSPATQPVERRRKELQSGLGRKEKREDRLSRSEKERCRLDERCLKLCQERQELEECSAKCHLKKHARKKSEHGGKEKGEDEQERTAGKGQLLWERKRTKRLEQRQLVQRLSRRAEGQPSLIGIINSYTLDREDNEKPVGSKIDQKSRIGKNS